MKTTSTWRRMIAVGCLGAMSIGMTGCSVINGACRSVKQQECLDEFMIGYRNQALAAKAWHRVKNCYSNKDYYNDFKAGFFAGYSDVAAGGPGCVPAVAPTSYWGWRYQSRDGQAAVNAYFEGYPLGVKAAEQDGVGHWGSIRPNYKQPQQLQPLAAARAAAAASSAAPDAEADDNPFFPQPVPVPVPDSESNQADKKEDESEDSEADDKKMELGDDPSGAIERALESALEGDDSVNYPSINDIPLTGNDLVPRRSAEFEIADRRRVAAEAFTSPADGEGSYEQIFGAPNAGSSASDEAGDIPYIFE